MLKRSPRSKYMTIVSILGSLIITFIIISTITTWRSDAIEHGARQNYYLLKDSKNKGDEISKSDLVKHEMFENDAPPSAINERQINSSKPMYAKADLPKDVLLTKDMTVPNLESTIDEDLRMIFVPTKDKINANLARHTDIIATDSEGYGSEVIVENAEIVFSAISESKSKTAIDNESGYFVKVTVDEAQDISTALGTGELHFALRSN